MKITRRNMLQGLGLSAALAKFPLAFAAAAESPSPKAAGDWRAWTIKSTIEPTAGVKTLLLPLPMQTSTTYQKSLGLEFKGNAVSTELLRDPVYNADAVLARFAEDEKNPRFEMTAHVATRDRLHPEPLALDENLKLYLEPTAHMPTTGLVAEMAARIAKGKKTADAQAHAFHNWICDKASRDPKVRGCGVGDLNATLKAGNFSGKCADLSSIFVGFCRASKIPAREVFGMRVGESRQFKCLGKTGNISKTQHCRAEYYSPGRGWVAVDPADVRKVILEEKLPLEDARVQAFRARAFGTWEMNWIAFNTARDFKYAQAPEEMNFLMYPVAIGTKLDSLEPEKFKYTIEV